MIKLPVHVSKECIKINTKIRVSSSKTNFCLLKYLKIYFTVNYSNRTYIQNYFIKY